MTLPRLIRESGRDNLVEWNGRVWVIPQSLGTTDLANPAHRARPGIKSYATLDEAEKHCRPIPPPPPPAPTLATAPVANAGPRREFACTWWERTDRYTEFVDGVSSPVYRRVGGTEERSSRDLPIGALYVIRRESGDKWPPVGADGLSVACVLPGPTHWYIDSRASNCTNPKDEVHRCWIRHGTFGGAIHVDKVGNSCQAGGGSIVVEGFHGHLHNHVLREC